MLQELPTLFETELIYRLEKLSTLTSILCIGDGTCK